MNQSSSSIATLVLLVAAVGGCSQSSSTATTATGGGSIPSASGTGASSGLGPSPTGSGCSPCSTPLMATSDAGVLGRPAQPAFGPTVAATVAPPPISGGTLRVLADGITAVVSDPDRDAIYVVDTTGARPVATIGLEAGDEPGRLVEDGSGRVHVALRGGGALVTIDPVHSVVLDRRPACPAPRGLDWDKTADVVWVACATGELLAFPATGGMATTSWVIERDLRDVLVDADGSLIVTTFRAAQVLRVGRDGTVGRRDSLSAREAGFEPRVAWRSIPGPAGTVVIAHQAETKQSISTQVSGAYGSAVGDTASSVVQSVVSVMAPDGSTATTVLVGGVLPVDVALSPDGVSIAVAVPGSAFFGSQKQSPVAMFGLDRTDTISLSLVAPSSPEVPPAPLPSADASVAQSIPFARLLRADLSNQAIAVAFDGAAELAVQTRQPAQLVLLSRAGSILRTIALAPASRDDTGHDIFHTGAGSQIACASCHPEGADDGFVWTLDGAPRRTPSLRGTIQGTAPYHWPGDEADFVVLTSDVYTKRMGGGTLDDGQTAALRGWVESIPAPPAPSWIDATAAARGQVIFGRSDTACASCHSGAKFTNNATVDVGTGAAFQVPSLVGVGWRFPFLHDGCAKTLADRFAPGACDAPSHGQTAQLPQAELDDLIAYLQTL